MLSEFLDVCFFGASNKLNFNNFKMAHEYLNRIRDLETRLEQETSKNRQMQEYVNFLKNTYLSYFDDSLGLVDWQSNISNNYNIAGQGGFF